MNSDIKIQLATITTDWGQHDFYTGMVRGQFATSFPNLRLVDISHDIPSFNLNNAAFVVRHCFHYFPKGTIHLVFVNSESSEKKRLLIAKHQDHYFVTPDNGIIGLLFSSLPEDVYEYTFAQDGSFASLTSYIEAVKLILDVQNGSMEAKKINDFDKKIALRATIDDSIISGSIIYIDSFRNAITNISRSLFERVGQGRDFSIFVQSNHNKITKMSTTYNQVEQGELLGIFNSANLLEIAIRNGYAAELLSLRIGGSIRINFSK